MVIDPIDVTSMPREAERYRIEARQFAEDAGRRLRLIAQLHDVLREVPRTTQVIAALDAIDTEARRSPWLTEKIARSTLVEDVRN
jgi:hypothetical protein